MSSYAQKVPAQILFLLVIDAYSSILAPRVAKDRHLSTTWRSKFLIDMATHGYKPGSFGRALDEYFKRDKVMTMCN